MPGGKRSKLAAQVQKALADPNSRVKLPEDPFEGFRAPLFDPLCTCGVSAICMVHARRLDSIVKAANERHGR